jgi:hypothetical protein
MNWLLNNEQQSSIYHLGALRETLNEDEVLGTNHNVFAI